VRVTPDQDALIRQAADLEHVSVTAFVLDAVTEHAQSVTEKQSTITLANELFDHLCAALDEPEAMVSQVTELFSTSSAASWINEAELRFADISPSQ
jgi:uncharacterized protein (DUF1778 family)